MNNVSFHPLKTKLYITFILIFLACLLFFSVPTLQAAKRGLLLWFYILLPTLLPYMIAINILLFLLPVKTSYSKLFLILGPLCGYPMGAKICASLHLNGQISKKDAEYSLPAVNMPSPTYLLSYLGTQTLEPSKTMQYLFCLYAPVLLYSIFIFFRLQLQGSIITKTCSVQVENATVCPIHGSFVDTCIMDAFTAITKLGGYMMIFSILSDLIVQIFSPIIGLTASLTCGILEITNGTELIIGSELPYHIKRLSILSLTSFGGISCIFQTKSMLVNTDISIKYYVFAKILFATTTAILACLFF